jgi:hypothetical protein
MYSPRFVFLLFFPTFLFFQISLRSYFLTFFFSLQFCSVEPVDVTYGYWDRTEEKKTITVTKGTSIREFLELIQSDRREFSKGSISKMLFVKDAHIVPHVRYRGSEWLVQVGILTSKQQFTLLDILESKLGGEQKESTPDQNAKVWWKPKKKKSKNSQLTIANSSKAILRSFLGVGTTEIAITIHSHDGRFDYFLAIQKGNS